MSASDKSVLVLSHLFPSPARPGLGSFVADSVRELARRHAIRVISPVRWVPPLRSAWREERRVQSERDEDGFLVSYPRVLALPFGGLPTETRLWPASLERIVRRICAEHDVGLVHAHFGLPDGWAGLRLARRVGLPIVVTLWGSDALVFPRERPSRKLLAEVVSGADHVIAASNEIASRAADMGASADRLSVIVGGVPSAYGEGTRAGARRALDVSEHGPLVVWVGGLVPVKRPALALAAFAEVVERLPDAQLTMIGDGPLRATVERQTDALGLRSHTRLTGHLGRASVALWQRAANTVMNSSVSEGTPFGLMESLVCGTRVAAVPVGGIPDLVALTDGGTLAANADSATALADAILTELLRPPDPGLADRARQLTVNVTSDSISAIYAGLASV